MCGNYWEMLAELYWEMLAELYIYIFSMENSTTLYCTPKIQFLLIEKLNHINTRLVDVRMDYATCAVFPGQSACSLTVVMWLQTLVTADFITNTYLSSARLPMTKCFENDRKSQHSLVLTKSLFTFLKMRIVLKMSRSELNGQGQPPMVQCIIISRWNRPTYIS